MTKSQGKVNAVVMFTKPSEVSGGWEKTDLWNTAVRIPGVSAAVDDDAGEARRFGSKTSGQVMLYSSAGQLLFHGGITESRGHLGDNDGLQTVLSLLTDGKSEITTTSVFGCALFKPTPTDHSKDACNANHK